MKGMKAMKKRTSIIAHGIMARALVLKGSKVKTPGGLKASDLTRNKRGKIVSKRASACGKKAYQKVQGWTDACKQARKALGIQGFVAFNGKTAQGKALYAKAKAIYAERA